MAAKAWVGSGTCNIQKIIICIGIGIEVKANVEVEVGVYRPL